MLADVCPGHVGALVTAWPLIVERVADGALGHVVPGRLWLLSYFIQFPFEPHSLP